jgi:2-C-methyl-D-erythritol 4-phosphate cytidylyltransferase
VSLGLEAAAETGAAVAAVPAKDTIKQATSTGLVVRTLDREGLWMVQTPQVFRYSLLVDSHQHYSTDVTDDAAMLEGLGHRVKVFTGSYANLKVTTSDDLVIAESLLRGHVPSHGK